MTADPRAALALLVSALERHLEVATTRRDPDDPAVIGAAEALAEAFDNYDETLFAATEVATPLAVYGDMDDEDDDDYDDDDDDDEVDPRTAGPPTPADRRPGSRSGSQSGGHVVEGVADRPGQVQ